MRLVYSDCRVCIAAGDVRICANGRAGSDRADRAARNSHTGNSCPIQIASSGNYDHRTLANGAPGISYLDHPIGGGHNR